MIKHVRAGHIFYLLLCLTGIFPGGLTSVYGQAFWVETFGETTPGNCDQGTLANGFASGNGSWGVTTIGSQDPFANQWYISAAEVGLAEGDCSAGGCWINNQLTNRTLHVGSVAGGPTVTCPAGDCGALYDPGGFQPNVVGTNLRVEGPVINCTGQTDIRLTFLYIENGDGTIDNATVEYYDGTGWYFLDDPPKTTSCNLQKIWTKRVLQLPPSCFNNPNVKLAFRWENDNGGTGINPSFAVDSITLTGTPPPEADFIASDTEICPGDCISFTDQSVDATAWAWSFQGGAVPATSTLQNPTNVCFPSAGLYTVQLIAYNINGSDTAIKTDYITVNACAPPVAEFSASDTVFCERTCVDFYDLSVNGVDTWTWRFPGASPVSASNSQNPTGICYPSPGTYSVTLIVENAYGIDSLTKSVYITVESCPVPVADFVSGTLQSCTDQCVSFLDQSTFTDSTSTWSWYFPGAYVDTSTSRNPGCVTYPNDGLYDVQLIVTNQYGSDTMIRYSYIRIESVPTAFVGPDTSMFFGNSYQLNAGGGLTYLWSPATGLDDPTIPNPIASPTTTTTYTVAIGDGSGCVARRQVIVTILHENDFFVPDAFSPNGDGRNDYLFVRGNNLRKMRFSIFNRWGEKLFETEDPSIGWDGSYKGQDLNSGVYTWVLTIVYDDLNQFTETGAVSLIR